MDSAEAYPLDYEVLILSDPGSLGHGVRGSIFGTPTRGPLWDIYDVGTYMRIYYMRIYIYENIYI